MIFLWETIPNAILSAGRLVRAVFSREPVLAPRSILDERLRRCHRCPRYSPEDDQCRACSCFVALKVMLATERCPEGRWMETTRFSSGLLRVTKPLQ